jgi:pyruvate/oxaloacetate carboxyltransferase
MILGDEQPIDCRPADLLAPGYDRAAAEIGELARSEEDVLSYAMFPQVARTFFENRAKGVTGEEIVTAIAHAVAAHEERAPTEDNGMHHVSMWKLTGRIGYGWR